MEERTVPLLPLCSPFTFTFIPLHNILTAPENFQSSMFSLEVQRSIGTWEILQLNYARCGVAAV